MECLLYPSSWFHNVHMSCFLSVISSSSADWDGYVDQSKGQEMGYSSWEVSGVIAHFLYWRDPGKIDMGTAVTHQLI